MTQRAAAVAATIDPAARAILGSQVVLDLYECQTPHLDDLEWVKTTLVDAARAAGATIVQTVFHKFAPWGISGVVVISESHLAIHIWPEKRYAAIDIFTCGDKVRMDVASENLKQAFQSGRSVEKAFSRGDQMSARQGRTPKQRRRGQAALVPSPLCG